MVLPFLALGAMALGGVVSAIGSHNSANQARKADEADRKAEAAAQKDLAERSLAASKVPLTEKLTQTTKYGQKLTTSYGQKVTSTGSIDFAGMVADAEAAGFNPLTVLRAGGLSGYMSNVTQYSGKDVVHSSGEDVFTSERVTTGHNAHLAAVSPLPGRGMASAISPSGEFMQSFGGAISNVGGAALDYHNQAMMTQAMAQPPAGFGGAGGVGVLSPVGGGGIRPTGFAERPLTNVVLDGINVRPDPRYSDAEDFEARYGDLAGSLIGLPIMLSDLWYTSTGDTIAQSVENTVNAPGDWISGGWNWLTKGITFPSITFTDNPAPVPDLAANH